MDYAAIYKRFNETSLIYEDEYGFEVNINGEWKLVLNSKNSYGTEYGMPAAFESKEEALQNLDKIKKDLKGKELRLVKGRKNDYYPV